LDRVDRINKIRSRQAISPFNPVHPVNPVQYCLSFGVADGRAHVVGDLRQLFEDFADPLRPLLRVVAQAPVDQVAQPGVGTALFNSCTGVSMDLNAFDPTRSVSAPGMTLGGSLSVVIRYMVAPRL
jgi:hypothetical protein